MLSHAEEREVTTMTDWLKSEFEDAEIEKVKISRGKKYKCLGMNFEFTDQCTVHVKMEQYVKDMIDTFPTKIEKSATTPAAVNLFRVRQTELLKEDDASLYHTIVAKGFFFMQESKT